MVSVLAEAANGSTGAAGTGAAGGGIIILIILILIFGGGGPTVPTVNLLDHRQQELPEEFTEAQILKIIECLESGAYQRTNMLHLPEYYRRLWLVPGIRESYARVNMVIGVTSSAKEIGGHTIFMEIIPLIEETERQLRNAIANR